MWVVMLIKEVAYSFTVTISKVLILEYKAGSTEEIKLCVLLYVP